MEDLIEEYGSQSAKKYEVLTPTELVRAILLIGKGEISSFWALVEGLASAEALGNDGYRETGGLGGLVLSYVI